MKRILYTLTAAVALLFGNYLFSNSTLEAYVETPTPVPPTSEMAAPVTIEPTQEPVPTAAPTEEPGDPYGELYFTLVAPDQTSQEFPEALTRLVRLPGSCVVGLEVCPPVQPVENPLRYERRFRHRQHAPHLVARRPLRCTGGPPAG